MKMIIVFFCAVPIAAICLELIRNHDYEDGLVGRIALWALFLGCLARASQLLDVALSRIAGAAGSRPLGIDAVETVIWVGLLLFLGRHYYRFRMWRHSGKYAWRDSEKAEIS